MAKLHNTQVALLNILRSNIDDPLSVRDLMGALGVSSTSVVQHHLLQLEKKGILKRNPSNPRDYQILSDPEKPISYLNLYGFAQCGPMGKFGHDNPIERVPIPLKLLKFPAEAAFLVEAEGTSMSPRINEGDLVIIQRKQSAQTGDTVLCLNDGAVLIKNVILDAGKVILASVNPDFPPFVANENFFICGIVRGVLQYN